MIRTFTRTSTQASMPERHRARSLRALDTRPGVAGVLIDSAADLLFTSGRAANRVSVYRCSDEALLGQVGVGSHPNGLAYDGMRRRLYTFNLGEPVGESCSASVVDVDTMDLVADVPLPGRPRWAVSDPERDAVLVNIRDPAQILVIDCERAAIRQGFPVPSQGPHGLWLDADCSAPPTTARSSCSTGSRARFCEACPFQGSQTSSCTIPAYGGSTWR